MPRERTVLHVLPHPGGGGETYVDALSRMEGYRFVRMYLAPSADPAGVRLSILRRAARVHRASREHDVLHVHGEVAAALCVPALAARPSVVTLHGLHLLRRLSGPRAAAARANLRLVLRAASRTICVSQAELDDLAFAVETARGQAVVIHNGVEVEPTSAAEREAARDDLGIPPGAVVGAWLGSLVAHKDPLTPIRASGKVTGSGVPLLLLVAGDGPLRPDVERVAREAGSAARALGFRPDVRRILAAADFFVLSSRLEGLSFALLEAMGQGLVPVVSDAPGNPEVVGDAGIVVPFGDTAGFAEAFARLASDTSARRALGKQAREQVVREFRADEMVRRTRDVYDELAALRR